MSRFSILLAAIASGACDRVPEASLTEVQVTGTAAGPWDPGGREPERHPVEPRRDPPPERVTTVGCEGSPFRKIQEAIDAAAPDEVIEICAGTWSERLSIVGKRLTLRSRDGAADTIVDAEGLGRALEVSGGADVVVAGLTFRDGFHTGRGGNVRCDQADLVVRDSVLEDGEASHGGGLALTSCGGRVEGNLFRGNLAILRGGGLYLDGTIDVVSNTFEANVSDESGGAAYVDEGFGLIQGNVAVLNVSDDDGGGIFVFRGAPWVDGNTFRDNVSGEEGGGLRIKSSEATITDNTFVANSADWRGGAMKVSHDESIISGNTYLENHADGAGGAVLLFESASHLSDETYLDNEADEGGAIAIIEGWGGVVVLDSLFDGNEADEGGHLFVELVGFPVTLRRVDLVDGEAEEGGAIQGTPGSQLDLGNVLLASNTASEGGGALDLEGVTGTVSNVVAIWNDAPEGAALRVTDGPGLRVENSVLRENTGGAAIRLLAGLPPVVVHNDFHLNEGDFLGMQDLVGAWGNVGVATGFVDAAGGDFSLVATSPLVDAGVPWLLDQDGTPSDIGLFGGPDAF